MARARNPHADVIARDLNRHLETVNEWIVGNMQSREMLQAMLFFSDYFPGQYSPTEGRKVWRGQARAVFDGSPRSYSYSKHQAETFAKQAAECGWFAEHCESLMVERTVCFHCKDQRAFEIALDLKKILSQYSANPYGDEQEVVLLNTRPEGPQAHIWDVDLG